MRLRRDLVGTLLLSGGLMFMLIAGCKSAKNTAAPKVAEPARWGTLNNGDAVELFTLKNANGVVVKITNYGGIVTQIHVPDRFGNMADVALGFDNLPSYEKSHSYFGAIIGRLANRLAKGTFTLDGKAYHIPTNNGENMLHGGTVGFDKKLWKPHFIAATDEPRLELSLTSPDGDQGFPGNLTTKVVYTLTSKNELRMDYTATTDKPTVVNLTNHTYFNLAGEASGKNVLGHELMIEGDKITPVSEALVPTGELKDVAGTPYDFTKPHTIAERLYAVGGKPSGYDVNFVLNKGITPKAELVARVREPDSGRVLEVFTTEPGLQFYSGNFLDGKEVGKGGVAYQKHFAFCLESQHFPDSPNNPTFPSVVLRPGKTFHSTTIYKFSTEK